jgi:hypothetical protein
VLKRINPDIIRGIHQKIQLIILLLLLNLHLIYSNDPDPFKLRSIDVDQRR